MTFKPFQSSFAMVTWINADPAWELDTRMTAREISLFNTSLDVPDRWVLKMDSLTGLLATMRELLLINAHSASAWLLVQPSCHLPRLFLVNLLQARQIVLAADMQIACGVEFLVKPVE